MMSLRDPTIDEAFRNYADLQIRRHYLIQDGKENTPDTAEIEDQMDEIWEKLDETQHQSLNGMGSDLNWVRRNGGLPPKGRRSAEDVLPSERQNLVAANASKKWHEFLHYLRICAPTIPRVKLAYLRGLAYDALNFPEHGGVFYEQAAEFDPANASMGVIALQYLDRTDPKKAIQRAEKTIAEPHSFPTVVLILSVVMILRRDEAEGRTIDQQRFSVLLNDAVKHLQLEPPSDLDRAMAYGLAACGFEIIDDLPAALGCYDEGLKHSPNNDGLLVGKGLLLYGSQTDQAVQVFKRAVQRETPLLWPYLFLAHHFVLNRNFDASLEMGRLASARATTNPVLAELLEWRAICLSELHFPVETVRSVFEKAVAYDPSNPQIAKNLAAFDEAVAQAATPEWRIEEASLLRTHQGDSMRKFEHVGAV